MTPPPIKSWRVGRARFTLFSAAGTPFRPIKWWEIVVGAQPAQRLERPQMRAVTEAGPYEGGVLSIASQSDRIDFVLTPILDMSGAASQESLPSLNMDFDETVTKLAFLLSNFVSCKDIPKICRLALGTFSFILVPNHEDGYAQMQAYLPHIKMSPKSSADFLYQINRPCVCESIFPELRINRLSKWAVLLYELGAADTKGNLITNKSYACSCDLDLNTAPEYTGQIPNEKIQQIFVALSGFGRQILERGDIE